MKALVLLISIICFWLILFISLGFALSDSFLYNLEKPNITDFNITLEKINIDELQNQSSMFQFVKVLKIMFLFQIPTANFPQIIAFSLSSINWLLFIIFGISLYRVFNPFA